MFLTVLSAVAVCCSAAAIAACKHAHTFAAWETVKLPTCTESGEKKRVCTCGEEEREEIAATGHRFTEWTSSQTEHKKICANGCGTETENGTHVFGAENVCPTCGYALHYTTTLTFEEIKNETEEIIGYAVTGCEGEETEIVVPAYHMGLPVTTVVNYAFSADEEDGGNEKYGLLKSVALPDTVTKIGQGAFECCSALEQVTFNNVEEIGNYVFYNSGITSIVLPESVKTVGDQVFQECAKLESVTFYCAPLLGDYLFYLSDNVKTIIIEHNETAFISDNTFYGFADGTIDFVFGDGVTAISSRVFGSSLLEGHAYVKSVTLGKNIREVGDYVFNKCSKITEIVLPEKLEKIGAQAFYECSSLAKVTVLNSHIGFGMSVFYLCESLEQVNYAGTLAEWSQIEFANYYGNPLSYGASFFTADGEIKEIYIDGVETVKQNAFFGLCVDSVTLGESVKFVEANAFGMSTKLPNRPFKRLVILGKGEVKTYNQSFGYRLTAETEIFYNGTAEEMKEKVMCNGVLNIPYFRNCVHYFYSESPETEEIPTPDSTWQFGGFWKFAADGKTIEKLETEI